MRGATVWVAGGSKGDEDAVPAGAAPGAWMVSLAVATGSGSVETSFARVDASSNSTAAADGGGGAAEVPAGAAPGPGSISTMVYLEVGLDSASLRHSCSHVFRQQRESQEGKGISQTYPLRGEVVHDPLAPQG